MTAQINSIASINDARRAAAKVYAAYFAGAPVNGMLQDVELRLLEALMRLYRKR